MEKSEKISSLFDKLLRPTDPRKQDKHLKKLLETIKKYRNEDSDFEIELNFQKREISSSSSSRNDSSHYKFKNPAQNGRKPEKNRRPSKKNKISSKIEIRYFKKIIEKNLIFF